MFIGWIIDLKLEVSLLWKNKQRSLQYDTNECELLVNGKRKKKIFKQSSITDVRTILERKSEARIAGDYDAGIKRRVWNIKNYTTLRSNTIIMLMFLGFKINNGRIL